MILVEQEFKKAFDALAGYAEIFWRNVMASGVIPQISAILGPCAGVQLFSCYHRFCCDGKKQQLYVVTGPKVVKTVFK
jgi:acetyl-CoA carboxylase carboxyltransferase component